MAKPLNGIAYTNPSTSTFDNRINVSVKVHKTVYDVVCIGSYLKTYLFAVFYDVSITKTRMRIDHVDDFGYMDISERFRQSVQRVNIDTAQGRPSPS